VTDKRKSVAALPQEFAQHIMAMFARNVMKFKSILFADERLHPRRMKFMHRVRGGAGRRNPI
jgi:hypothetical protein